MAQFYGSGFAADLALALKCADRLIPTLTGAFPLSILLIVEYRDYITIESNKRGASPVCMDGGSLSTKSWNMKYLETTKCQPN